jgi:hypothetical protein
MNTNLLKVARPKSTPPPHDPSTLLILTIANELTTLARQCAPQTHRQIPDSSPHPRPGSPQR